MLSATAGSRATDEDRTLSRLRGLRSDLIDPAIDAHRGRIVKRTGDGSLIEFRSVVDAVRCAIEVQNGLAERNAGLAPERRIEFRIGIHLGDVVEESDGDLMGDGVNIAARLEGVARARRDLPVRGRLPAGEGTPRSGGHRPRPNSTQEHRRADPGLLAAGRRPGAGKAATRAGPVAPKSAPRWRRSPLGVVALLIVLAGGAWRLNRPAAVATRSPAPVASNVTTPAEARHLSIVVLPFANLSNDPAQDYFADGVTENLTTDLSRLTRRLRDRPQLRLHLQGQECRRPGNRQGAWASATCSKGLSSATPAACVSMSSSSTPKAASISGLTASTSLLADLFEMQDEIVARLANQLGTELTSAEAHRAERVSNPDSMDLFFQGLATLNKGVNVENMAQARGFFERAFAVDPSNLDALLEVGRVDYSVGGAYLSDDRDARLAAAEAAIAKVLSQRPNDALAHEIMGAILNQTKRSDQGIAELERALALDPNLATAHGDIGLAKIFVGSPRRNRSP